MEERRIAIVYGLVAAILLMLGMVVPRAIAPRWGEGALLEWKTLETTGTIEEAIRASGWSDPSSGRWRLPGARSGSSLYLMAPLPDFEDQPYSLSLSAYLAYGSLYLGRSFDSFSHLRSFEPDALKSTGSLEMPLGPELSGSIVWIQARSLGFLSRGYLGELVVAPTSELRRASLLGDVRPIGFSFSYLLLGISLLVLRAFAAGTTGLVRLGIMALLLAFFTFRDAECRHLYMLDARWWDVLGAWSAFVIPLLALSLASSLFTSGPSRCLVSFGLGQGTFALVGLCVGLLFLFGDRFGGFVPSSRFLSLFWLWFLNCTQISLVGGAWWLLRVYKGGSRDAIIPFLGVLILGVATLRLFEQAHIGVFIFLASFGYASMARRLRKGSPAHSDFKSDQAMAISVNSAKLKAYGLSAREMDVFYEALKGRRNDEIGRSLFISERTVKTHLTSIFSKLHVASKLELMSRFSSSGSEVYERLLEGSSTHGPGDAMQADKGGGVRRRLLSSGSDT